MLTQLFQAARIEAHAPLPYVQHLINSGLMETAARLDAVSAGAGLPDGKNLATRFLDARLDEANFSDRFLQSAWSTLTAKLYPVTTEIRSRPKR